MAHDIRSPGVSVRVIDQTQYPTVTQGTVVGAVGFAEKGPVGEPTLITSKDEFVSTFGEPIADNYYFGMFADKFLEHSTGYFTRVAKEVDYEQVCGTEAPALDFTGYSDPAFWVELSDFPEPNNGLYRVTISPDDYADVDALIDELNSQFGNITLNDGSTTLDNYLTAELDETETYICFTAGLYRNVRITVRADYESGDPPSVASDNIAKTSGDGNLGMEADSSSEDAVGFTYAFVKVPVNETEATNASISSSSAVTQEQLNQISAFNRINIAVDGTDSEPFRVYEDVDITPAEGDPAGFPRLEAGESPSFSLDLTDATDFTLTLSGFYHFQGSDTDGDVNATHNFSVSAGPHSDINALVTALNDALGDVTINSGTLEDYVQFADNGDGQLTTVQGANTSLFNYGSQVSIELASDSGAGDPGDVADLGYSSGPVSESGSDATWDLEGVAEAIESVGPEFSASASSDILTISSDRLGGTSYIRINTATTSDSDAGDPVLNMSDGTDDTGDNPDDDGVVNFVAKEAGSAGNDLRIRTYTSTNPVTDATLYNIEVYVGQDSVENFNNVDWTDDTASNFVKTVLEDSDYITVDFGETLQYPNSDTGSVPTSAPPNNDDSGMPEFWELSGGNDGIPTDSDELEALVVEALDEYTNVEQYQIDILTAPGFTGSAVVNKLQDVGEVRRDIIALVDPPPFLTYKEVIDWHNGNYSGSSPLTSSFVVTAWGWQRDFDPYNEEFVDLPPSIYMAVAMARTQKNFELWEAPAGPVRGIVNSISSYTKPTQAQREYLYNDIDPACVNPIVQFPAEGILIYGQKTCLKQSRATNRINVRRLVNHVKRNVERISRAYLFELSTASTWANITRDLNSFLGNIEERGGLTAFGVTFDETTNTPARIDAGIMYGKIFIQPTRVAERIFIDLTIQRTGASTTEA